MPIGLRITLLFVLLVMVMLALIFTGIYYFNFSAREKLVYTRLSNRALTTGRLLAQRERFDEDLVHSIDSLTTVVLTDNTVQAYNAENKLVYHYSESLSKAVLLDSVQLNHVRKRGLKFF